MLPVKRVDHISMAAPSWREQQDRLEKLLGFTYKSNWTAGPGEDFNGSLAQVPGTAMEFEIIEPANPDSFVQKYIDAQGPGLHHITVEVQDIHEAMAELERQGIKPFGGLGEDRAWKLTYIHPKDSGGILWQLFVPKQPGPLREIETNPGAVGLKRVDHVSMAVPDAAKQAEWQARVFGMVEVGSWTDDYLGYDGRIMTIPGSKLQFEIISPTRADSFVQKFIDTRRAGMHHICCEVESVEGAAAGLRANGIEPFGGIIENDWKKHTFLHPKDSGGVLFQLFEEGAGN